MTTRIDQRFAALKAEGRAALVTFLTAGDPDRETSLAILRALPAAGADVVELGMPFTDPMADGPAIQMSSQRAIKAGQTLAMRYREKGQYLRSFVAEDSIFIDIMMNVGIIFYAARETSDRRLRDVAVRHCITTRRYLVRGDGSTAHEGIFDLETGEFLRQSTQQGFRGDSCWSRGLSWAMYGFTTVYEYSRDPHYLETAQACADFYITHSPPDGVPPLHFRVRARTAAPQRQPDRRA